MKNLDPRRILAISLLLLAAAPAEAMTRCTGKDGKVTYTDGDCDVGAKASGVPIHDSSGMDINKRTNSFSHTPASSRGTARHAPASGAPPTIPKLIQGNPGLLSHPNPGVRQHERYRVEQENKKAREEARTSSKE